MEPRAHKALPFVLQNFHENLPANWQILILHTTENANYIKEVIATLAAPTGRFQMNSLGVSSLSYSEYNRLLKQAEFYEKFIPTETFLIFQVDSILCAPHKELLNKFLEYDYVGAPWKMGGVGNGGLSLRKRSAMIANLRACPAKDEDNEDIYFARDCDTVKLKRPSEDAAREFSIETIYNPASFGIHKPWNYLLPNELDLLEQQCPGMKKLQSLQ